MMKLRHRHAFVTVCSVACDFSEARSARGLLIRKSDPTYLEQAWLVRLSRVMVCYLAPLTNMRLT